MDEGLRKFVFGFEGMFNMAQWLSWLERRPVTAEVEGSSPFWVVIWDLSSAGRASALQAEGHRFEPCRSQVRLLGQAVKTSPFHGGNTGSIPVGVIRQKERASVRAGERKQTAGNRIWRHSQVVRHGSATP